MNPFIDIAKLYNIISAKIQHSQLPVTARELNEMVELADEKSIRIRDALKQLHKAGRIIKVPVSSLVDRRERVGYQWNNKTHISPELVKAIQSESTPKVAEPDDIRINVNEDHSITIITKSIRITVEVPQ
jgi:hypothetical protein